MGNNTLLWVIGGGIALWLGWKIITNGNRQVQINEGNNVRVSGNNDVKSMFTARRVSI